MSSRRFIATAVVSMLAAGCVDLAFDGAEPAGLTSDDEQPGGCEDDTTWRAIIFLAPPPVSRMNRLAAHVLGGLGIHSPEECGRSEDAADCTFCLKGTNPDGVGVRLAAMSGDHLSTNKMPSNAGKNCALLMVRAAFTPADSEPEKADEAHSRRDNLVDAVEKQVRAAGLGELYTLDTDLSGTCVSDAEDYELNTNNGRDPYANMTEQEPHIFDPNKDYGPSVALPAAQCVQIPPRSNYEPKTRSTIKCPFGRSFRRLLLPEQLKDKGLVAQDGFFFRDLCLRPGDDNVFGYADHNDAVRFGSQTKVPMTLDWRLLLAAAEIAETFKTKLLITSAVDGNRKGGWSLHKPGWAVDLQSFGNLTTKALFDQHRCAIGSIALGIWGKGESFEFKEGGATYQLIREKRPTQKDYVIHLGMVPEARVQCHKNRAGAFIEDGHRFSCPI